VPEYTIEYRGMSQRLHRDGTLPIGGSAFWVSFVATLDGAPVASTEVSITSEAYFHAANVLGRTNRASGHAGHLAKDAMIRFGVREIEVLVSDLQDNASTPTTSRHELKFGDVDQLLALLNEKDCDYRVRQRRDLFCTAAAPGDSTARLEIDGRISAPTSRPLCRACALPPAEMLCSHLLHPQVTTMPAAGGIKSREVVTALCDRDRSEVEEPAGCAAGLHSCWQRLIQIQLAPPAPMPPLSVAEAFDAANTTWRMVFGQDERLLTRSGSMAGAAALAVECGSRTEFDSLLSALADVIDQIRPGDALLPPDVDAKKVERSLDRLHEVLKYKLPAGQHARVEQAVQMLRRVRQARNAVQHSGARGGLVSALRALGIYDASPRWSEAWDLIRARTVAALTILREELIRYVDAPAVP
jgi:hypothetical protein